MKVLFLTLVKITNLEDRGIYQDLLNEFVKNGHEVYIVSPSERKERQKTQFYSKNNAHFLRVWTLNIQKTHFIEKGLGTLLLEYQYLNAIKNYLIDIKFDLVLYSTPPITFEKVISYIKKRDKAYSYLLLKDIFPQNAVDLGMLKENGLLHKFFRKKEEKLYQISDTIGCMSNANKEYILKHNKFLDPKKVEVNPNSIAIKNSSIEKINKEEIRLKYNLPLNKKIFVYGGNLGKPQGIDFLIEIITQYKNSKIYFLIIGSGTEFKKIQNWFIKNQPINAKLLSILPKVEYDQIVSACDLGLIFLNKKFTIPNFPSRLLSYLEFGLPVISITDENTDIGDYIEKYQCGSKLISGELNNVKKQLDKYSELSHNEWEVLSKNAKELLNQEFLVGNSYELINKRINV